MVGIVTQGVIFPYVEMTTGNLSFLEYGRLGLLLHAKEIMLDHEKRIQGANEIIWYCLPVSTVQQKVTSSKALALSLNYLDLPRTLSCVFNVMLL